MAVLDWIMILAYFGVLGGVVWWSMRRNKIESEEDLFLGGRSVGWLAIGASIFAANIGSEHLIGLAGSGAVAGLSQSHWEFHAWVLVMMSWVFLPFYYNSGVSTMPEFLERRFGAKARWILSLVSLAAYVLTKISVTVFAGALFFEVMMPEMQLTIGGTVVSSFWIGAVATVVLAGVYSSIGGLSAVVYTDLVQTGIILAGTLSVTGFALYHLGHSGVALPDGQTAQGICDGWQVLKATIKSTGNVEQFGLWHSLSHKAFPWLGVVVASATIGVWYWCTDQFIIQRTLAAKNMTNARRGAIWGGFLKLAPVFLFLVPGMLGFALHHNHVQIGGSVFAIPMKTLADGTQALNGDTVFPTLVQTLLPVGFRGLVVAGMIAALMSSLASLFNSVSTLFTVDVYQKLKPHRAHHDHRHDGARPPVAPDHEGYLRRRTLPVHPVRPVVPRAADRRGVPDGPSLEAHEPARRVLGPRAWLPARHGQADAQRHDARSGRIRVHPGLLLLGNPARHVVHHRHRRVAHGSCARLRAS